MAEIRDFNTTAANNDSAPPDGWPEGMARNKVNDSAREMMAALARWAKETTDGSITTGGTATAYTVASNRTLSVYYDGLTLMVEWHVASGASPTVNVDSLGAKSLVWPDGTAVASGELPADGRALIQYDGTNFQVLTLTRSAARELTLSATTTELTIASGSIAPAGRKHTLRGEGGAADDLEVMPATNFSDGAMLLLRAGNASEPITVKHDTDTGATGDPKIFLADDADFALDDAERSLLLELRGGEWHEIGRSVAGGTYVARAYAEFSAAATGTTAIPQDDTIPQNTEGDEYMTLAFTPSDATNRIRITVTALAGHSNGGANSATTMALFKDSDADAIAATSQNAPANPEPMTLSLVHELVAGGTSEITFKVRIGRSDGTSGTITFNGSASARLFGAIPKSSIVIEELTP